MERAFSGEGLPCCARALRERCGGLCKQQARVTGLIRKDIEARWCGGGMVGNSVRAGCGRTGGGRRGWLGCLGLVTAGLLVALSASVDAQTGQGGITGKV